jgi:hypothetical protein
VAMLLSLIDIRPEGRTVNTHESSLFTGVRGSGILRSSRRTRAAGIMHKAGQASSEEDTLL